MSCGRQTVGRRNTDNGDTNPTAPSHCTPAAFATTFPQADDEAIRELDAAGFASMRLVVLASDGSAVIDPEHVIASYDDLYLLQYASVEQAMTAYVYYREHADAVEPDAVLEAASETLTDADIEVNVTEDQNPIAALADEPDQEAAQEADCVIALIDTGASEGPNVVGRVSLIDEALTGSNSHADDMVTAIVSQNPDAQILSIRAMGDDGRGTVSSIVAAMEYAISQQAGIINLSLYAKTNLSNSVLASEIQKAVSLGIEVVGAAGNDGADVAGYMPGSVEEAWIIGAANADGTRLAGSNYGATVDYYVVAGSTSEAAAKFTGYVSLHGSFELPVNEGLIYETDYVPEEQTEPDETETDTEPDITIEPDMDDIFDDEEDSEINDANGDSTAAEAETDASVYGLQPEDRFSVFNTRYYWIEDTDYDYEAFVAEAAIGEGESWSYFTGKLSFELGVTDYITYALTDGESVRYVVVPFEAVSERKAATEVSEAGAGKVPSYITQREAFIGEIPAVSGVTLDGGAITVEKDSAFNVSYVTLGYDLGRFCVNVEDDGGFDVSTVGSYKVVYDVLSYHDAAVHWYVTLTIEVVEKLELEGSTRVVLDWPAIYAVVYFADGTKDYVYYGTSFATDKEISYIRFGDSDNRTEERFGAGAELFDADGAVVDESLYEIVSDTDSFYKLTLPAGDYSVIRLYNTVSDYYDSKGGGFEQNDDDEIMLAAATKSKSWSNGLSYGSVSVSYNSGSYNFSSSGKTNFVNALNTWLKDEFGYEVDPKDLSGSIYVGCADSGAAAYDYSGWSYVTITATVTYSGSNVSRVKLSFWCVSNSAAAYGTPTNDPSHAGWKLGYQRFSGSTSVTPDPSGAKISIKKMITGSKAWRELAADVVSGKATFGIYTDADCTQLYDTVSVRFTAIDDDNAETVTCDVEPHVDYYVAETSVVNGCASRIGTKYGPYNLAEGETANVVDSGRSYVFNQPFIYRLSATKTDNAGTPVAGAIFRVQYSSKKGEPVLWDGYFKTGSDGKLIMDDTHYVSSYTDESGTKHTSDAFIRYSSTTSSFYFPNGYVKVWEVLAPDGYLLNETVYEQTLTSNKYDTVRLDYVGLGTIIDPRESSHIQIKKTDTDGAWDSSLTGAQFTLYEGTKNLETITITNSNYHAFKYDCEIGKTYTIKETKTPAGYQKAADIVVKIEEGANYKETYSYDVKNVPEPPKVQITKASTASDEILGLNSYSKAGAEFGIYTDAACTNKIQTLITDINGQTPEYQLPCTTVGPHTYWVREDVAPPGHVRNTTAQRVDITLPADRNRTIPVTISDDPYFCENEFEVIKKDYKYNPIPNVVFKVELYDGNSATGTPKKIWYLQSDRDGIVKMDDLHLDPNRRSDSFYTWNGDIVIPIGCYLQVTEVESPAEYIVDTTPFSFLTTKTVSLTSYRYNEPYPVGVKVVKYGTDGKTPLQGVTFELEFVSEAQPTNAGSGAPALNRLLKVGQKTSLTTNANGELSFDNLDQGTYRLTETETLPGYSLLKDPIEFTLPLKLTQGEILAQGNVDVSVGKADPVTGLTFFYECTYEVTDNYNFKMPFTGSTGTWKYGYIGVAVIAALGIGTAVFTGRRRKRRKKA